MLANNMRRCAFLFTPPYMCGRLNDLTELVRQVIFAPHSTAVNCYTWTDRRRRDRHHSKNHPLWASILIRKTYEMKVGIGHLLECRVNFRRRN
jgi:hypothetical protein